MRNLIAEDQGLLQPCRASGSKDGIGRTNDFIAPIGKIDCDNALPANSTPSNSTMCMGSTRVTAPPATASTSVLPDLVQGIFLLSELLLECIRSSRTFLEFRPCYITQLFSSARVDSAPFLIC